MGLAMDQYVRGKKAYGKAVIENCFKRDQDRMARNKSLLTRVNDAAVNPDKWSKMNVSSALRVFEFQTLCEIAGNST